MAYDSSYLQSSFQRHVGTPAASHEQMVTNSPSSPSTAAAAAAVASSPFLPGYLLGDTPVAASPAATPGTNVRPGWSHITSGAGGHGRLHGHHSSPLAVGSAGSLLSGSGGNSSFGSKEQWQLLHATPSAEARVRDSVHGVRGKDKDKPAPPPVHGLFDVMASSGAFPSSAHGDLTHSERLPLHVSSALNRTSLPDGRMHASHISYSSPAAVGNGQASWQQTPPAGGFAKAASQPLSPAQVDPFYTQGEALTPADVLDERWVTVFGFQPAAAAFVLRQFSQYGAILEHVMCGDGNWMHLHYQTKIQARKALSKNGKIIGNNIMVGVTPCIDKDVMARPDENLDLSISASSNLSRLDGSKLGARGGTSSLRPLTAAYKSAASLSEVAPRTQTPKKSTGLLSKAMEYMFGW